MIRMASIKKFYFLKNKVTSVGEALEKLEPLYAVGRKVKWCSYYKK